MKTLESREDIELLVRLFYERVQSDELLAPLFKNVHWPDHLPVMYNFWSSMILGDFSYQGQPFAKHLPLNLRSEHFQRWLMLFHQTVDENFSGDRAIEIRERASTIAKVWQHKLGLS